MNKGIILAALLFSSVVQAEVNYLESQVRFYLPSDIKTIREAAVYFLSTHQYRLIEKDPIARAIAQRPIPAGMPMGKIMTIEEALLGITSEDEAVIIDTKNRLVTFNKLGKELSQ